MPVAFAIEPRGGTSMAERESTTEVKFRDLVEGLGAIVWEATQEPFAVTFMSLRAEEVLGYPVDRWLNEPDLWQRLLHPEDLERVMGRVDAFLRGDSSNTFELEYRVVAADGRLRWIWDRRELVRAHEGRAPSVRGLLVDITERKRSEEAQRFLARAGEELAYSLDYETTLQSVARQAVPFLADYCMVEAVGPDGRLQAVAVAHVDPAKEEFLRALARHCLPGLPASLRVLQTGDPLLIPEFCDAVLQTLALDECFCQIVSDAEQLAMLRALRPTSVIWVPLAARGRTLGVLCLAWADSGRRYGPADLALAQALARHCALAVDNARLYREAQEAVRAREEFLATTSHELRTPLSHIKGFASTLLQPDVEWDEATRRDFLGEIDREADRLGKLISNLLDMSRLESGGAGHLELRPTPPAALVARGLDRVRAQLGDRAVDVDPALSEFPPVLADAAGIEHVVANLVENAAKYAPGGPIRIAGALADGDHSVELWVEDEGPGVPPGQMEHLFEKFYRGRTSEQSGIPGTGLGLAIARSIVERHGGRIRAENRPEGGARFAVALPTAAASEMHGEGDTDAPIDPDRG